MATSSTPDFHVALSFAGEDRRYVERVANALREIGVRVFYDKHEVASLWGKDLYTHPREVYTRRVMYTVMFHFQALRRKAMDEPRTGERPGSSLRRKARIHSPRQV
jgi:hypothetical protein